MQELCLFKSQNQLTNFIDSRNFIYSRHFYTFKKLCAPDLRMLGKAGYKGDIKGEIKGNSGIDKIHMFSAFRAQTGRKWRKATKGLHLRVQIWKRQ